MSISRTSPIQRLAHEEVLSKRQPFICILSLTRKLHWLSVIKRNVDINANDDDNVYE